MRPTNFKAANQALRIMSKCFFYACLVSWRTLGALQNKKPQNTATIAVRLGYFFRHKSPQALPPKTAKTAKTARGG